MTSLTGFIFWLLGKSLKRRGPLRAQLQVEQLEARYAPAAPLGVVDGITSDGRIRGWAYDKDTPSRSIQIRIYLDGRVATTASTDQLSPDVNAKLHIGGRHG